MIFQKVPGVIAFYTAKDIPGDNSFTPLNVPLMSESEQILCSARVKYYGEPAGIIVADKEKTANKAAKLVKIIYSSMNKNKPLISIADVMTSPEKDQRIANTRTVEPTEIGNDVKCVVYGEYNLGTQHHFYIEPQTTVTKPTEDGMEVYTACQWLDLPNVAIAQCLKMSTNKYVFL